MFGKSNHSHRRFWPLKVLFFIMVAAAFLLIVGWIVQLLWNAIVPDITGFKKITYWQAVGLLALCKILFGGFGGRGKKRWAKKKNRWKNKWDSKWSEKWQNMSEEDRAKMKARWKDRCRNRTRE